MKAEATDAGKTVRLGGTEFAVWEARTEKWVPFTMLVARSVVCGGGALADGPDAGTVSPTPRMRIVNGAECRRWEGTHEKGGALVLWVHRIAVAEGLDTSEFDGALTEVGPPEPPPAAWPLDPRRAL